MRADHTAENFAVLRHIVLNILKPMDNKMSVACRHRHCVMSILKSHPHNSYMNHDTNYL